MLTLDDDESDLALMALEHFIEATAKACRDFVLPSAAKACCEHVAPKVEALIDRIQQHKMDEAEERADG